MGILLSLLVFLHASLSTEREAFPHLLVEVSPPPLEVFYRLVRLFRIRRDGVFSFSFSLSSLFSSSLFLVCLFSQFNNFRGSTSTAVRPHSFPFHVCFFFICPYIFIFLVFYSSFCIVLLFFFLWFPVSQFLGNLLLL
jgi:hypothetical protein